VATATEGRYKTVKIKRLTKCKIGAAIYLHPVALIFVNIIVDQIWLKATIFGLLMHPLAKDADADPIVPSQSGFPCCQEVFVSIIQFQNNEFVFL